MRTADIVAITFSNLLVGEIARVFDVAETASPKPGDSDLKLLEAVSNLIGDKGIVPHGDGAEEDDEDPIHRGHHALQPAGG